MAIAPRTVSSPPLSRVKGCCVPLGQPTVSHHLGKLRAAGFVRSHREGIWAFYRLRDDMPPAAAAMLGLIP